MSYALSTPITGPDAWLGRDMASSAAWIYRVSATAIDGNCRQRSRLRRSRGP